MAVYKDAKRGTWYFICRDRHKKQIKRRGYLTKKEAKIAEMKFIDDSKNGFDKNLTFVELERHHRIEYIKGKQDKTIKKYDDIVRLHLLPFFENHKISTIHQLDIFEWKEYIISKKLSKEYSQTCYTLLSRIFNHAIKYFDLSVNVVKIAGNFVIEDDKKEMIVWEEHELFTFLEQFNCENPTELKYYTFFKTLYYTGMRLGEALALQWEDIDFENSSIQISKSSSSKLIKQTKTKASIRVIYLPPQIHGNLYNFFQEQKKSAGFKTSFFVFGDDEPLHQNTLDYHFRKKLYSSGLKKIRIHDFRHSHASYLFQNNFSILYISKRLGHKTITTTQEIYIHLTETLSSNEDNKFNKL